MNDTKLPSTPIADFFNKAAASHYDAHQRRFGPLMDNLHFLIGVVLNRLPDDAHILCVGVGTGGEILRLADAHPKWRFTGIDPSADMLDVCRAQVDSKGLSDRVTLLHGYLNDFPEHEAYDGVLCLLVTQFVRDVAARQEMFTAMARSLKSRGYLINAELSDDLGSPGFKDIAEKWTDMNLAAGITQEQMTATLSAWQTHLAVVPLTRIEEYLRGSGFALPVQFFQSLVIHAWYAQKG